jgi:hypothetical protein
VKLIDIEGEDRAVSIARRAERDEDEKNGDGDNNGGSAAE